MIKEPTFKESLAYKNKELAKEWDYKKNYPLTPKDVFPNSHKFVWWICKCGRSWKAQIQRRNEGYLKCKKCYKKIPFQKRDDKYRHNNCLANKNPELAKEWHPTKNGKLTPKDVLCRNGKDYWWNQTLKNILIVKKIEKIL